MQELYLNPYVFNVFKDPHTKEIICIQESSGLYPHESDIKQLIKFLKSSLDNYHLTEIHNQKLGESYQPKSTPQVELGFIYIASDSTVDFLKIGYSLKPKLRESTLQAQRPTIKFLYVCRGSMAQEKAIHKKLSSHRVRGEWFDIKLEDAINVIEQTCFK